MADKFVRSIREVKEVNKLAEHITTENDLVSTTDGSVYIVTKNGYKRITGLEDINTKLGDLQSKIDNVNPDDENITSEVEALQTQLESLQSEVSELNIPNYDTEIENLKSQIDGLDIPTDVNKQITTTNWEDINIKNDYTASDIPDFNPSYCVVDYGSHKEVFIRFGFKNLLKGKNVVGDIPSELVPHKMYRNGTTTIAKIPPKIVVTTSGDIEIHPYTSDEYIDTDYVIYQGSWIIKEDQ